MSVDKPKTVLHLVSRGKACRGVYFSGTPVDFEITLLCTDDEAVRQKRSGEPTQPFDENRVPTLFEKLACSPTDDKIEIKVACAQLLGICLADSTWINNINDFEDGLSGPAPQPPAPDGDEPDAGGWNSWWGWLNAAPQEQRKLQWVGGAPQPAVANRQRNYQMVIESSVREVVPKGTFLRGGEARTFAMTVTLPPEIPSAHAGYSLRYVYYVSLCAVWSFDGVVHEHVLKIPITIWNPASSLRPVRPPYTPPGFEYQWSSLELSRTRQSEVSRRAALPCFSDYPESDFQALRAGSPAPAAASPLVSLPSSQLGDLLADDGPRPGPPPAPGALETVPYHANTCRAIEHLLSLPQQQETLVKHNDTPFLRVTTQGLHVSIGDAVTGFMSAVDNDVCRCARVTIKLEYEEHVPSFLFKSGTFVPSPRRQFNRPDVSREEFISTRLAQSRTVEELDEVMLDCDETSFSFILPPSCSPTTYTDKVAVEWVLVFEFFFVMHEQASHPADDRIECERPIVWQLPLQVHAPTSELRPDIKTNTYVYAT
ncbi:hypothetical protein DIPPA_26096 [Diplonema papillatum]|nr:hypothetical protein DIPPA_26096 [Diplonema papillatum]